ncbi:hypothetical protein BS50DRAFT_90416 [Corynespora cassiicola Philippines]|uniref:Uncharacterized protein n=1 Tax=Corynespora cassiicola Philippines TaxID=1448308 RepID=A0A2T2NEP6_CORCC|nr:hypothetical protein BS50DRAFT_90416 [Corynespora cassiicola Philippines]
METTSLDCPECNEPPPLSPAAPSAVCQPSARAPPALLRARTKYHVSKSSARFLIPSHTESLLRLAQESSPSPQFGSGGRATRAPRANANSGTTAVTQTHGFSTISVLQTRSRKDGAKYSRERMMGTPRNVKLGPTAEKEHQCFVGNGFSSSFIASTFAYAWSIQCWQTARCCVEGLVSSTWIGLLQPSSSLLRIRHLVILSLSSQHLIMSSSVPECLHDEAFGVHAIHWPRSMSVSAASLRPAPCSH